MSNLLSTQFLTACPYKKTKMASFMAIINTIDDAVFLSSLHERANLLMTKFAHIYISIAPVW